jgi:hypothetical protein
MRYSPSQAQASRSLERIQYSPRSSTHRQTHLGASQYPLSPVQRGISNARYSPSREDISYEYNPDPDFLSSLLATTRVPSAATSTNALTHISPDNQAGRATDTTNLPFLPGGSQDGTGKHRGFIVQQVPTDISHRSIVMMFPVSCNTNLIMGLELTLLRSMNILPLRVFVSSTLRLGAHSPFRLEIFERPSMP